MTKKEILENYRLIVIEIETLEKQSDFLNQFIGGPRPLRSVQLTGMPRGTNDPTAAMIQRADYDDALLSIENKTKELQNLLAEFERIMDTIEDRRLQIIIRDYYALGWSEERTGEHVGLSRQHVNRLRTAYIDGLK